jgi:hypothetical protein
MSICSDVLITREEARTRVKNMLMFQQERLIDLAISSMDDWELTHELNSDMYFYNIVDEDGNEYPTAKQLEAENKLLKKRIDSACKLLHNVRSNVVIYTPIMNSIQYILRLLKGREQ